MDYTTHYNKLIERARGRVLEGYTEKHHIIPKCLGGLDNKWNIVHLTPEEHYVAHQLLVKMYPGHRGLVYAASLMGKRSTNKEYGWLRRSHSEAQSKFMKENPSPNQFKKGHTPWNKGIKGHTLGYKHKEETKQKISEQMKGIVRGPMSDEHKNKIRASNTGKKQTEETRKLKSEIAKNLPPVVCPHCDKTGKKSAMVRWHFDNCKIKETI